MTPLDPSSRPSARREGDGREPPGAGSKVVHHVSDAPKSAMGSLATESGPSVVISPQAEQPLPRRVSKPKRPAEATLVIRDKRRVEELREGVRRIARRRTRQRLGSILLWGGASALAFGFGTAVAFFLATAGKAASAPADDSIPTAAETATPLTGSLQLVKGHGFAPMSAKPGARGQQAASGSSKPGPAPSEHRPKVVSLSDLPDAAVSSSEAEDGASSASREEARASSEPRVISLEDL